MECPRGNYGLVRRYYQFSERHPILNISGMFIGALSLGIGGGLFLNYCMSPVQKQEVRAAQGDFPEAVRVVGQDISKGEKVEEGIISNERRSRP